MIDLTKTPYEKDYLAKRERLTKPTTSQPAYDPGAPTEDPYGPGGYGRDIIGGTMGGGRIRLPEPWNPTPIGTTGDITVPWNPTPTDTTTDTTTGTTTGTTTQATTGGTMTQPYDYSQMFGNIADYFPQYGTTQAFNYPKELEWASQDIGEMSQYGRPTTSLPWYQQAKGVVQTDVMDAIKQAAEQAGLGGMRWSTPMGRTAQDISGRRMAELGQTWAGMESQAQEAAANRSLSAMGMLPGVAQMRQQMPMDLASQAYGMGTGMQGAYNQMLSPFYQEFMRTQPENSPWLNYALGMTGQGGQMAQQQYQQSPLSQGLQGGQLALLLALLSSKEYKKDISRITAQEEEDMYNLIKDTPLFKYRYKFESDSVTPHLGMITEEAPAEVKLFDHLVGLYEYISTLHATLKTLIRKIEGK